jgi:hypothetical protein
MFYEQHSPPQITAAKHINRSCLILQNKPMRVFGQRDGHSATYFKTEDTLVEDAHKVKILHDNDMYRFLHKHVQSDSDKRTECNASMQNAPCMDNLPYFYCEK